MKKIPLLLTAFVLLLLMVFGSYSCGDKNKPKDGEIKTDLLVAEPNGAFLDHRDSVPTKQQYNGPLFVLSHDYPTSVPPVVNPSWQKALNGQPISAANVFAYMDSLKSYIAPKLLPFFSNNKQWTSAKYGWFNEPWVGAQREAILGTYLGNGNPANMFKSLKVDEAGYVLVLYDSTAAYTVGQIWGKTGQKVNLVNDAAQFKEGSVIVKLAFSNINYPDWPVMKNAQTYSIYDTIATKENPKRGYQVRKVSFFQMDVIVKDSKTAPKTGWVYSTFVYDMNAPGTPWAKMVPLGAMWGNDPGVNSPIQPPYPKLYETVINPQAPAYSKETLGWGGRLSGPNDGAVAQVAVDINTGKKYTNLALSSCMSCHSPAQDTFKSFLLPGPFPDSILYVYTPGSPEWNLWFRDNDGDAPFNSGQVAMDYDMVMAFKSIPAYLAAQPSGQHKLLKKNLLAVGKYRHRNSNSRFWH
ncbi:hypothetical protein [Haliscomenobacter hydrossis]|uniref:Cytochrome c domain-containing protein n=1 Tax=Haliscomenobacter hydrossis (strain ATCC 27775 / DSM 1100 / LMG 10767 / O) TaxID=760192 RepID=F4L3S4_HALH1|nr:hypothetical protein [Haliscomenobacter hydrossis]AEE48678.1 hypothetical protein Halhy_0771 [Haliscomenobacter hydrossis DSM 1100]